MAIVYVHTRLDNHDMFYVGVGKSEKRAYSKAGRSRHWHNIVNKVGYSVIIWFEGLSYEDALLHETKLIAEIGRQDLGKGNLVNKNDGGSGGSPIGNTNMKTNFTKSVCPKCGKEGQTSAMMRWHFDNCGVAGKLASERAKSKNITRSDETKQKMSKAQKGKLLSKEIKQKISDSHKGKKLSQETKDKIIQTKKQNGTLHRKPTEQQIQKGLQTKLEKGNYYPTQETKKKVSESMKGMVRPVIVCIYCNKTGGINGMKRYHFDNCKHKP